MTDSAVVTSGEPGGLDPDRVARVVDQLPVVAWCTDRALRVTSARGGGLAALGDAVRAFEGRTIAELFESPADRATVVAAHRRALTGESVPYEVTFNGRAFSAQVEPARGADTAIVGVLGIGVDVTERWQAQRELRAVISLLQSALETTAEGVLVLDLGGRVVSYNRRFVELFGIPRNLAHGRDPDGMVGFVRAQLQIPDGFLACIRPGTAAPDGECVDVIEFTDGRVFEQHSVPQRIDGRPVGRVWSFRDVTGRVRAERALRESEMRLRTIIETEPECVKLLDTEGRVLEMNPAGLAMVEAECIEQVRGSRVLDVVAPEHRAAFADLIRRVLAGESGTLEFEIVGLKGTRRWMTTHGVPLRDDGGGVQAVLGITRDITERKRAEEQSRASRAALRRLAARQADIREEERTRMAREIHDQLGQSLTALKLELSAARDAARRGEAGVGARLAETTRLVDDLVKTVRRIATELRPPILDQLGLPAAVEWLAEDFHRRTGIACDTTVAIGEGPLDGDLATGLFRIVQEALTNVLHHAGAGRVWIAFEQTGGVVTLSVTDDGRGITEAEVSGPRSLGILGMRERAAALGGALEVGPAPQGGTRVSTWVPAARTGRGAAG